MNEKISAPHEVFRKEIWDQLIDVAAARGNVTVGIAREAAKRLFESTGGDASKATVEAMEKVLTEIDLED